MKMKPNTPPDMKAAPPTALAVKAIAAAEKPLTSKSNRQEPVPRASAILNASTQPKTARAARGKRHVAKDRRQAEKKSMQPIYSTKARNQGEGREVSKKDTVIALLRRERGASLEDLVHATGWQPHSVRGFLSGVLRKKMHMNVKAGKRDGGELVYSLRV